MIKSLQAIRLAEEGLRVAHKSMEALFRERVESGCAQAGFTLLRVFHPEGGGLEAHVQRPDGVKLAIDGTGGAERFAADLPRIPHPRLVGVHTL